MPESCDAKLSGLFAKKCGHKPKQGVSKKWYFNIDDVDRGATLTVNRGTKVTALVLKAGAKLYPAEGSPKTKKIKHALTIGDFANGYIHTDEFTVTYRGEEERERIQELVDGARVGTINKMVDTGLNGEISYNIAGLESGMDILNDDFDSNANSGATTVIVATKEGEEEGTGLKLFLMAEGAETSALEETEAWIAANEYVPVP